MKTEGSHVLSHPASTSANAQPSAVQRAVMNRHNQARRSASGNSTKPLRPQNINLNHPSRSQSMTSHTNSPIAMKSPHGSGKGGTRLDENPPQRHPPPLQPRTHPQQSNTQSRLPQLMTSSTTDGSRNSEVRSNPGTQSGFYPSPYQTHLEQLGMLKPSLCLSNSRLISLQSKSTMRMRTCLMMKTLVILRTARDQDRVQVHIHNRISNISCSQAQRYQWECKDNLRCNKCTKCIKCSHHQQPHSLSIQIIQCMG